MPLRFIFFTEKPLPKSILLIGTLDTKGAEYGYVCNLIKEHGHQTILLDGGIVGDPTFAPNIDAATVAEAGGTTLAQLREQADRGLAVEIMAQGAANLTLKLYTEGKVDGILALGGSGGTAIATPAMRQLPIGLPKVMVSTIASGNVQPYVGIKDITMMHPVVDIAGLNRISRRILANAVGSICGMVEQAIPNNEDKPLIATTMFGVTTPCVTMLRRQLETAGYEVLVFHATGNGGKAMESLIADGFITGVADVTTSEWCDELVGGVLSAGPHRLEAAAKKGIPQVVSVGALDIANFWAIDTVPAQFKNRTLYKHNPNVTLMRTTPEESTQLGKIIANKLNQAQGPTALFIPLQGISAIDTPGQPFHLPQANAALFDALRQNIQPPVELVELDMHINDPDFAVAMANKLLEMLKEN